jgi:hypothetical protein
MANRNSYTPDPLKEINISISLQRSLNSNESSNKKNPTQKKPENLNFLKRDAEKNFLLDEKFDHNRFEYFFRFRIASLIKILGFQKYYRNENAVKDKKKNVNIFLFFFFEFSRAFQFLGNEKKAKK